MNHLIIPWAVAYSIVALVVLLGNGLVIVSFWKNTFLRTHTNYFIVSLAATDCFVGIISIPWWIVVTFAGQMQEEKWYALLHNTWVMFDILGGVGSILHLVALSWDRLCAVVWPLRHRIYTGKRYLFTLALIWTVAIPVAICSKPGMKLAPKAYNLSVIILCFFIPLFIVCITQAIVLISLRLSNIHITYKLRRNLRNEVRVAKTVFLMIAFFMIGWLPFFTLSLISYVKPQISPTWQAICAVKFLQYSNSAINPVLYAHKFPQFRRAFAALLCPCRVARERARTVGNSFGKAVSSFSSSIIHRKGNQQPFTSQVDSPISLKSRRSTLNAEEFDPSGAGEILLSKISPRHY